MTENQPTGILLTFSAPPRLLSARDPNRGPVDVQDGDERTLVEQARGGSAAAFEELVRRCDRDLLRLACRLTGSAEAARDLYQETFLRAFRSLREFRGDCAFRTWVLRIASHHWLDRARRRVAVRTDPPPAAGPDADRPMPEPADRRGDPERELLRLEIRNRLREAIDCLAPRERLVFEMRHHQGERLTDIAVVLETTEETVRNCLYRAHRRLREILTDLAPPAKAGAAGRGLGRPPGGSTEQGI
jgi:RNA polymerase sigma-70 factor (ECF subfamily)